MHTPLRAITRLSTLRGRSITAPAAFLFPVGEAAAEGEAMAGRIWRTFSKPNRDSHAPVGEVRTSVTVSGDVSGQLAVGSHIVQMRVDTVLGNLVTVLPPDAKANVTPRPVPISLVPRRPALLVGRQHETALAVEALSGRRPVELYAPAGM